MDLPERYSKIKAPHLWDNLQGKDYFKPRGRLLWFRSVHPAPEGRLTTDFLHVGDHTIVTVSVWADGTVIAMGSATVREWSKGGAPRDVEKAETAALGRALAHAGFGTEQAFDMDDSDHLSDSPVTTPTGPPPPRQNAPSHTDPENITPLSDDLSNYLASQAARVEVTLSIPSTEARAFVWAAVGGDDRGLLIANWESDDGQAIVADMVTDALTDRDSA